MNFKNPSLPNLIMAMKKYIKSLSLLLAALSSATAFAQDTKTGYFHDEYTYRYQMNPAVGNDRGFVSMPALGNLNVGINGTLHLNSVIYNVDGRTTTFMNPQLSAGEVLGKFKDMNRIGTDLKLNVFSVGFNALGGYNTVSVNARADVGVAMGTLGTDSAIEAADAVIMSDNLTRLPTAIKIARKTERIARQNIVFALAVKLAVLALVSVGISGMWMAVFADVGVAVLAILNSFRTLLGSRRKD